MNLLVTLVNLLLQISLVALLVFSIAFCTVVTREKRVRYLTLTTGLICLLSILILGGILNVLT